MSNVPIAAIDGLEFLTPFSAKEVAASPGFAERVRAEVDSVNAKLMNAETGLRDLAAGNTGNIHHVMLTLEDARLSFQLLVQTRNKLLESYQELMRMQV